MDKNQTLSLLHSIDTEYCLKKKDATMRIIEARQALREKSSDRQQAEDQLQSALDAYSLLNLEHQAERSKAWSNMDRSDEDQSLAPALATTQVDGIYLILQDGRSVLYCRLGGIGGNTEVFEGLEFNKNEVAYIGIKMGETKIAVSLKEQEATLVREDAKVLDDEPSYTSDWEQARVFRLNGKEDTKVIIEQGTDIVLSPKEYIPSFWELQIIYLNRYLLEKALAFVGAELFKDDWYWSSTSRSANGAWILSFIYGLQGLGNESTTRYRVRPVSAIIW